MERTKWEFTIDGICDVNISSEPGSPSRIAAAKIASPQKEIDIFEYVPAGWRVWTSKGGSTHFDVQVVQIREVPDFDRFRGLPNEEFFRYSEGIDWLLTALHEVGHAHNQYQYAGDMCRTRNKTAGSGPFTLEEMTDVLSDEMAAWSFALQRIGELKVGKEKMTDISERVIYGGLRSYVDPALDPVSIRAVRGIQPQQYVSAIVGLYSDWLRINMPDLKAAILEKYNGIADSTPVSQRAAV